ncbi:MAG: hypothetical protein ABL907_00345 [Hyphomicrobium sp.]
MTISNASISPINYAHFDADGWAWMTRHLPTEWVCAFELEPNIELSAALTELANFGGANEYRMIEFAQVLIAGLASILSACSTPHTAVSNRSEEAAAIELECIRSFRRFNEEFVASGVQRKMELSRQTDEKCAALQRRGN